MEDKLIQIKCIVRTDLTDDEIKNKIRLALKTLPELRIINRLEVS